MFAIVEPPEWLTELFNGFDSLSILIHDAVVPAFIAVLGAAAVIWTSAIAWRKFKETTNKV